MFAGPLIKVVVFLAKNVLAPLTTMASTFAIDGVIERKIREKGVIATSRASVLGLFNRDQFSYFEWRFDW